MKIAALVLTVVVVPALASPTSFVERGRYASGAAVVEPADGGEYVYLPLVADSRITTRPVLAAQPVRELYVFFSAQEEAAMLAFRDQQLAQRLKRQVVVARRKHFHASGSLNWPKVVVRVGDICVPELASSEATDWREHLVCHHAGETP